MVCFVCGNDDSQGKPKSHLETVLDLLDEGATEFDDEEYREEYGPDDLWSWKGFNESGFALNHYATTTSNPSRYNPLLRPRYIHKSPEIVIPIVEARMTGIHVVTIVKDEAPFLDEWIRYHLNMGVQHFWIFDNGSKDNATRFLEPHIKSKVVTYTPWDTANPPPQFYEIAATFFQSFDVNDPEQRGRLFQKSSFSYAVREIKRLKEETGLLADWIMSLDVDEFVTAADGVSTLEQFTSRWRSSANFTSLGCVVLPWNMFYSNGHFYRPVSPVISSYNRACGFELDRMMKSMCYLDRVTYYGNAHLAQTPGYQSRSADLSVSYSNPFTDWSKSGSYGPLYTAHYYTKSFQDFVEKVRKRNANKADPTQIKVETFFNYHWSCWYTLPDDRTYRRFLAK